MSNAYDDLWAPLEALLFVSADPVRANVLADALGITTAEATEALEELAHDYETQGRGIVLREVAGGWRLFTDPAYHELVESFVQSLDTRRLTQAALETLAVIAYRQPATREGIRAIRGVNSDSTIASLIEKGLVHEIGRREGGAVLYGTTTAFLEQFGLRSLDDLPPLEDFAPDEETRRLIAERLGAGSTSYADDALEDDGLEDIDDGGCEL